MARILVCEDDDAVRAFVARALQLDGHTLTLAGDGEEGFDRVREANGDFDLVLSDIRMPLMDGIEMAENISAFFPNLPILLMTGYADQRERAESVNVIVVDVVPKPFSLQQIRESVRIAVAGPVKEAC